MLVAKKMRRWGQGMTAGCSQCVPEAKQAGETTAMVEVSTGNVPPGDQPKQQSKCRYMSHVHLVQQDSLGATVEIGAICEMDGVVLNDPKFEGILGMCIPT
jgi:hypothetical protein